jgi:AGZA family xanthine/uracil permease-like MFS transporter
LIERYFKLAENQSTVRRELLGGLTTFMTMAYVIVVNPQILAQAGMPADGVLFATCFSAAAASLVMGLYANYPIALAPGMSLNAYFTYSVCLGMHLPWQTALGVVFFSGVLFILLTVTRVREQIVNGIPDCLKHSTAAGIGMFIAFVGLRSAKLVVANPATFVGIGSFSDPSGTFLQLDLRGAAHLGLLEITFAFLFVDLFDNVGTLVGVCEQAGFVKDGKIPGVGRALLADAVGTVFGSLTGTSTVTSYIESAAGVAVGARTGLSNLVVAGLFLAAVFFSPVVAVIPAFATAPALILMGALMTQSIAKVKWEDYPDAFPAFVTMAATPLTFSIATGLSLGLISFTVAEVAAGKFREVSILLWILTALFTLRYIYLAAA